MNEIIEILTMRDELWHPLSSHIPLALLVFAPILKALIIFSKKYTKQVTPIYLFSLYIGLASCVVSIFLGDIAAEVIRTNLNNHQNLNMHEELGYWALGWFVAALVFGAFEQYKSYFKYFCLIFLTIGSIQLIRVGHLGAKMVYDQGAGVIINPTQ